MSRRRVALGAAALTLVLSVCWNPVRRKLTDGGSFQYSEAMAWDYTLQRIDGVWKVVARRFTGLSYTGGGSELHPDSA